MSGLENTWSISEVSKTGGEVKEQIDSLSVGLQSVRGGSDISFPYKLIGC